MSVSSPGITHRAFAMDFGTRVVPEGGVEFRLWAPSASDIDLLLTDDDGTIDDLPMEQQDGGWFVLLHPGARPGHLYRFRVDGEIEVPDPGSRFQAADVHGPSVILDPASFPWRDSGWTGRPWEEAVVYELHVGSFSPQGTYAGVRERLDHLAGLGITAIELMPLAQFPGRFNWGYDGTLLFAPYNGYGTPDDLKELVQAAHRKDIMVLLDVVYNHFGPEGNYLHVYAGDAFFTEQAHTPWGAAINFSGPESRTVRDFYIANALYWLEEYHLDGLRLDAVHAIVDESSPNILEEIAARVHAGPGRRRHVHLVLENDHNRAGYLKRGSAGEPRLYTAQWNDDIHHACHVLLTGETTGYYADYADDPIRRLGRCLTEGFAYQGESSPYRGGTARGEPSRHLPPAAFVSFLQNHDQIGNRALGERLIALCPLRDLLVVQALMLLAPSPPLLFMGEEFGADSPFYFFSDFGPELASSVTEGRRKEFARFPQFSSPETRRGIPDPCDERTFVQSRLNWGRSDAEKNQMILRHCRELLQCRLREIVPRLKGMQGGLADFIVHGPKCLEAGWIMGDASRLTALLNLEGGPGRISPRRGGTLLHRYPPEADRAWAEGLLPSRSIIWLLEAE
jgi:maltooligosyltrehalose trehalohydrolase